MSGIKAGDRVSKEKVLKVANASGTVEKVTSDYVVVIWDGVNGHWHYTKEQAKSLKLLSKSS